VFDQVECSHLQVAQEIKEAVSAYRAALSNG
jgi:hypothetical protein